MTDRELLEYIAAQVGKLTVDVEGLTFGQKETNKSLESINNVVTCMENEHGQKLEALFDGYKQNAERLDRIEKHVASQEEFILRRIK